MRTARGATLAVVVTVLTACAAASSATTTAAPSAASSLASAEASAEASVLPSVDDGAPDQLQGKWEATISTGEHVTLELRAHGYTVNREGAEGSGSISVDGQQITFSSSRCELGTGTYDWSIQDGTLTFTPLEPRDPCGNRIIFLENAAYTPAG